MPSAKPMPTPSATMAFGCRPTCSLTMSSRSDAPSCKPGDRITRVVGCVVIGVGGCALCLLVHACRPAGRSSSAASSIAFAALLECLEARIRHGSLRVGDETRRDRKSCMAPSRARKVPPFRPTRCYGRDPATPRCCRMTRLLRCLALAALAFCLAAPRRCAPARLGDDEKRTGLRAGRQRDRRAPRLDLRRHVLDLRDAGAGEQGEGQVHPRGAGARSRR